MVHSCARHWVLALLAAAGLFVPLRLAGAAEGDVNADSVFDSGDVVSESALVANPPASASLRIALDFDRSGYLDAADPRFLAGVLLGKLAFLPAVRISIASDGPGIFTREESIDLPLTVEDTGTTFTLSINGVPAATGSGSGTAKLTFGPLALGFNLFNITYEDGLGRILVQSVEIHRDIEPPTVRIDTPLENELIRSFKVPVTGQAVDNTGTAVVINGYEMKMEKDGRFSGEVTFIGGGGARLTATAIDAAGNRATAARNIEIYVSDPDTKSTGPTQIDLPEGAMRTRGETASVDVITNTEVKSLLGPGSDLIVTQMPLEGWSDGVIILPSGMMISVESGEAPEGGLAGTEPVPMFSAKPAISLENEGGASNATPLWIFQIIPDVDGDGKPELSLASRARVETEGPLAGRIVPIQGEAGFPGIFEPKAPVFESANLGQVQSLAGVQRMMKRHTEKWAAGGTVPTARVTFYCCAASAITPVVGQVKCDPSKIDDVYQQLGQTEVDLAVLRTRINNLRDQYLADAASAKIGEDGQNILVGYTTIPGTTTKVPTFVNGKILGCLKKFLPEPVGAAISKANTALDALGVARTLVNTAPKSTSILTLISLYLLKNKDDVIALGNNVLADPEVAEGVEIIKKWKGRVDIAKNIYSCGVMVQTFGNFVPAWARYYRPDNQDKLNQTFAEFDAKIAQYKNLESCRRQWVASRPSSGIGPAPEAKGRREWLPLGADPDEIEHALVTLQQFITDANDHEDRLANNFEAAGNLLNDATYTKEAALNLLDQFEALLLEEKELYNRKPEFEAGLNAVQQAIPIMTTILARVEADSADAIKELDEALAAKGAFDGSAVTLQGSGAPFSTVSDESGRFTHFVFTDLTIEGVPPDKVAILEDRPYDADASALGGLLGGRASGNSGRHVFPFTPFSTVDFNAVTDVGEILIGPTVEDTAGVPPTVQIIKPFEGLEVPAGFPLRVRVNATDDVGVLGVEVYVGGVPSLAMEGGTHDGVINVGNTLGPLEIKAVAVDPGRNFGEDTVTITVIDGGAGAFTLDPPVVRLTNPRKQQFTATYRGTPAQDVVWRVNNFEGGDAATVGSISAAGFYDGSDAVTGSLAVFPVSVSAELPDFPGYKARAKVLIIDSGDVISPAVAFSFASPAAPGGLLVSRPFAFSLPSPALAGGRLVSRPFAFSFPSPAAPGGSLPSRPIAFKKEP